MLYQIEHEPIAIAGRNGSVANQANEVDTLQRIVHCGHHATIEGVAWLVHPGRINQDNLALGSRNDSLNFESSGLRLVGNGGNLFADQAIEQR